MRKLIINHIKNLEMPSLYMKSPIHFIFYREQSIRREKHTHIWKEEMKKYSQQQKDIFFYHSSIFRQPGDKNLGFQRKQYCNLPELDFRRQCNLLGMKIAKGTWWPENVKCCAHLQKKEDQKDNIELQTGHPH